MNAPTPTGAAMSYMEQRRRWMEANRLPYGDQRKAREALAADLGISATTLYKRAKAAGWPASNDVPRPRGRRRPG